MVAIRRTKLMRRLWRDGFMKHKKRGTATPKKQVV